MSARRGSVSLEEEEEVQKAAAAAMVQASVRGMTARRNSMASAQVLRTPILLTSTVLMS